MDEELRFHLDTRIQALKAQHVAADDAERLARREFGDVLRWKEEGREVRGLRWIDEMRTDLRYAARQLRRSPTFSAIVILILGVGIGAAAAVFSVINAAMFKTLSVPRPHELRQLEWRPPRDGFLVKYRGGTSPRGMRTSFSYPTFDHLRAHSNAFVDVFSFLPPQDITIVDVGDPQLVKGQIVSGNFFRGLEERPLIGRTLTDADETTMSGPWAVVVSYGFWKRTLEANPEVVGRALSANGAPVIVVGVMPALSPGIMPDRQVDLFLPASMYPVVSGQPDILRDPERWQFQVFGRVRSDVAEETARAEVDTLLQQTLRANPPVKSTDLPRLELGPGEHGVNALRGSRQLLWIFMAAVGIVLAIACANIAGMLVARGSARRKEVGSRLALGAGRGRIVRQLVTEALFLSLIGGVFGVAIAYPLSRFIALGLSSAGSSGVSADVLPDARVLAFMVGLSLVVGVASSVIPALRTTRVELLSVLKPTGTTSGDRVMSRAAKVLATVQVALSLLLLIGAAMLLRTFVNLRSEPLGFDAQNLLVFEVEPGATGYQGLRLLDFYRDALSRIAFVPGVRSASVSVFPTLSRSATWHSVPIPGPARDGESRVNVYVHWVAPRFFETMGIPLKRGRDFTWLDREGSSEVVIVNEAFATLFFGTADPLGQHLTLPADWSGQREVIGVAADAKYTAIGMKTPPTVYHSYRQREPSNSMTFAVRTTGDPTSVVGGIRRAIFRLDAGLPLKNVQTQIDLVGQSMRLHRLVMSLISAFGAMALALACLGIYGTVTYAVTRRTREIGLRIALGATSRNTLLALLRQSMMPVVIGCIVGIVAGLVGAQAIERLLFGVDSRDPWSVTGATLCILATSLLAIIVPARRATLIDPMRALRQE